MTDYETLLFCVGVFFGVPIGAYANQLLLRAATARVVEEAEALSRAARRAIDEHRKAER